MKSFITELSQKCCFSIIKFEDEITHVHFSQDITSQCVEILNDIVSKNNIDFMKVTSRLGTFKTKFL